ncbi:MAG: flavin-dependent oxidoreductase [Casimicrobiaceae bacterium]
MDVIIVGAGVGGLTLALALQQAGIPCRVFEAAETLRPVGVGINILPHAARVLSELGLEAALSNVAIATREAIFFNRFGQLIYREPLGRHAGYEFPQFSIHRSDLQQVLINAFLERVGPDRLHTAHRCRGFAQDGTGVTVFFHDAADKSMRPPQRGRLLVACDGLHSVVRRQLHPEEGEPRYSGVNMWRGTTRWTPILTGASMIRAGWLAGGKMVIYPIRDRVDGTYLQLVNWVAEIATRKYTQRDWSRPGQLADFLPAFADWHFDWLDVPAFLRAADAILEFPMIDQDPLPWWSRGRVTLLGDAAHPMVPRGSNGAGQAILDARALTDCLVTRSNVAEALLAYEATRLQATADVVLANRRNPPDAILREVFERTGDRPFAQIEDVISEQEIRALSDGYKRVAGYARPTP